MVRRYPHPQQEQVQRNMREPAAPPPRRQPDEHIPVVLICLLGALVASGIVLMLAVIWLVYQVITTLALTVTSNLDMALSQAYNNCIDATPYHALCDSALTELLTNGTRKHSVLLPMLR